MRPIDRWARRISEPESVPRLFRDFMPGEGGAFPYTLYAPADRWGWRKTHPKLICVHDGCYIHLELGRQGVAARAFPFAGITRLEMGRVLLHAWIRISGLIAGEAVTAALEFNSVVEPLFRPVAEMIRAGAAAVPFADDETFRFEGGRLDDLAETSYKFANFVRDSIMPGEKVLCAVFEPGRTVKRFPGRRSTKPAHLLVLTDRELIQIKEDEQARREHCPYGGIWNYIPLGRIERFAVAGGEAGGGPVLSVRLADGHEITVGFSSANGENVRRLAEGFAAAQTTSRV